jgi:hypothetical protein
VGALSKVTGTLGDGCAAITFDQQFIEYRRNFTFGKKPTILNNLRHNLFMVFLFELIKKFKNFLKKRLDSLIECFKKN